MRLIALAVILPASAPAQAAVEPDAPPQAAPVVSDAPIAFSGADDPATIVTHR